MLRFPKISQAKSSLLKVTLIEGSPVLILSEWQTKPLPNLENVSVRPSQILISASPQKKVTINLAPAELEKDGTHLDLPIALAILVLSQQLLPSDLTDRLFIGELSLDGTTKPVRGIINAVEAAQQSGFQEIFVPIDNLPVAQLVPGITSIGVSNLKELLLHLKGIKFIHSKKCVQSTDHTCLLNVVKNNSSDISTQNPTVVKNNYTDTTLDSIYGQHLAKRALTIALAGQHNILLCGPPGSGKTLLAHTAASLLPPLTPSEFIEVAKINSLLYASIADIPISRPFRSPHHTASPAAIIGGGPHIAPGEISLAHRGVLFLDELPEFSRSVIESLRQPLESNVITIARAQHRTTYPANFTLIATMNPCPCGYRHDPNHECTCSTTQINNYQKRISGPILDRFDIVINMPPVPAKILSSPKHVKNTKTATVEEHTLAKSKINLAFATQQKRYHTSLLANGKLGPNTASSLLNPSPSVKKLPTNRRRQASPLYT